MLSLWSGFPSSQLIRLNMRIKDFPIIIIVARIKNTRCPRISQRVRNGTNGIQRCRPSKVSLSLNRSRIDCLMIFLNVAGVPSGWNETRTFETIVPKTTLLAESEDESVKCFPLGGPCVSSRKIFCLCVVPGLKSSKRGFSDQMIETGTGLGATIVREVLREVAQ